MNLTDNAKEINTTQRKHHRLLLTVMLVILFIIIILSFGVGYYPLTPSQVLKAFLSKFGYKGDILPQAATIFWNIRLPRILSALFSRFHLSGNVSQSAGISGHPWCFIRCQSWCCFCYFKRSFKLGDSAFCFCRRCDCSCRILPHQPKVCTLSHTQSCTDRNYDHVTLQCGRNHDQIHCRSQ